jgi:hypothetical protein
MDPVIFLDGVHLLMILRLDTKLVHDGVIVLPLSHAHFLSGELHVRMSTGLRD